MTDSVGASDVIAVSFIVEDAADVSGETESPAPSDGARLTAEAAARAPPLVATAPPDRASPVPPSVKPATSPAECSSPPSGLLSTPCAASSSTRPALSAASTSEAVAAASASLILVRSSCACVEELRECRVAMWWCGVERVANTAEDERWCCCWNARAYKPAKPAKAPEEAENVKTKLLREAKGCGRRADPTDNFEGHQLCGRNSITRTSYMHAELRGGRCEAGYASGLWTGSPPVTSRKEKLIAFTRRHRRHRHCNATSGSSRLRRKAKAPEAVLR